MKIKKIFYLSFGAIIFFLIALFFLKSVSSRTNIAGIDQGDIANSEIAKDSTAEKQLVSADINGINLKLEVASSSQEQELGLGGRSGLLDGTGMLFVFREPYRAGFWMKNMKFSIDIIWLDSSKRIVSIARDVSPDTYPEVFYPDSDAGYAVELSSGFSDQNNIKAGDKFNFSNF